MSFLTLEEAVNRITKSYPDFDLWAVPKRTLELCEHEREIVTSCPINVFQKLDNLFSKENVFRENGLFKNIILVPNTVSKSALCKYFQEKTEGVQIMFACEDMTGFYAMAQIEDEQLGYMLVFNCSFKAYYDIKHCMGKKTKLKVICLAGEFILHDLYS